MSAPTQAIDGLIEKLEGRESTDRLIVMAQNPVNNHHWSLGLGMVSAAELLAELTFARDVRTVLERRGFAITKAVVDASSPEAGNEGGAAALSTEGAA